MTRTPSVFLGLALVFCSCQRPNSSQSPPGPDLASSPSSLESGSQKPTDPQAKDQPAEAKHGGAQVSQVAFTVNNEAIPMADVRDLAQARGIGQKEAMLTLVQAAVVAQEARRNGFPAAQGASRLEIAAAYLTTLFSAETLCETISQRELKGLYESAYKPDWPADIYVGDLLEVRCCLEVGAPCDAPDQKACLASLDKRLPEMLQIARKWQEDASLKPKDLVPVAGPYIATDFVFLDWPGIPDEKQTRKRLLDAPTRKAIKLLQPGQVSAPLVSSLGIHLVRLNNVRKAVTHESPEFQLEGREYLCKKRVQNTRQDYVKRLVQFVDFKAGVMALPKSEP